MDIVRLATTSASVGLLAAGIASGCGASQSETGTIAIDVYAASSLTDVYAEIEREFEESNPDIDVRLNLAGSSTLARQINDGAPADVFAPADLSILDQLDPSPTQTSMARQPYATNRVVLVVPAGNSKSIATASDLAQTDVLTAKCIDGVPCGDVASQGLAQSNVELGRVTEETNVRSVLAKVAAGEVDAGFVYRTDAEASADVEIVGSFDAPEVQLVVIDLNPDALNNETASSRFVAYVRSEQARSILTNAGFEQP